MHLEHFGNLSFTFVKAIIGAEYVLRWLPVGTHDWNKFLKPEEIEEKINNLNFFVKEIEGLEFSPFTQKWKRSKDLSVNYIITSVKN